MVAYKVLYLLINFLKKIMSQWNYNMNLEQTFKDRNKTTFSIDYLVWKKFKDKNWNDIFIKEISENQEDKTKKIIKYSAPAKNSELNLDEFILKYYDESEEFRKIFNEAIENLKHSKKPKLEWIKSKQNFFQEKINLIFLYLELRFPDEMNFVISRIDKILKKG